MVWTVACVHNEDSDQPMLSHSLIRVFVGRIKKLCILGYPTFAQWRFWADCAGWSESSLRAHVQRYVFWRRDWYGKELREIIRFQGRQCCQNCSVPFRKIWSSKSLWSLRFFWRESNFISWYSKFKDTRRVVSVAILAASCCIFSNSSFSYWAQLSQTTFPYSRIGLTNAVYIISSDLRSSLSFLIVLIRVQALSLMYWIWWCQNPSLEKYKPTYVGVNFFDLLVLHENTVDSRYLEFQGTLWNTSRYP